MGTYVLNIVVILSAGDCCGMAFSPTEPALQIVALTTYALQGNLLQSTCGFYSHFYSATKVSLKSANHFILKVHSGSLKPPCPLPLSLHYFVPFSTWMS